MKKILFYYIIAFWGLTACEPVEVIVSKIDPTLEAYLVADGLDSDGKVDGHISAPDAIRITRINFETDNTKFRNLPPIHSLVGIDQFKNLEQISISQGAELNVTALPQASSLKTLYLSCPTSTSIDFPLYLTSIFLGDATSLDSLNVSALTRLEHLSIRRIKMSTLDLSKNRALNSISLSYSNNINIDNKKSEVKLHPEANLTHIYLNNFNAGLPFDYTKYSRTLTSLTIQTSKITSLEPTIFPKLIFLSCSDNMLSSLDVSKNLELRTLYVQNNPDLKSVCINSKQDIISSSWTKSNYTTFKICD